MFSYVHLFDRTYGRGDTAREFEMAVDEADAHDAARHIADVYDRTRGACGSYVPGTLCGPIGERTVYFAPPEWRTDAERQAYGLSVRIGDAHEYSPDFGDPAKLGSNFDRDPLAEIDATFGATSTLRDPGVARDLTADRVGAWFGVTAFGDPSRIPEIPLDDGANLDGQVFAKGGAVPAKEYLALELSMIARALGRESTHESMLGDVARLGVSDATDRLVSDLTDLVDRLIGTDRDKLARYYASFSVRHLQFGWRVAIDGEEQRWRPHYDFAMGIPRERLIEHFLRRVESVKAGFSSPLDNPSA
jgi:hypothetical protein